MHLGYNKNTVQPYLQALTDWSRPRARHGAALTTNHTPFPMREQFRLPAIYYNISVLAHKQWQVTMPTKYVSRNAMPCVILRERVIPFTEPWTRWTASAGLVYILYDTA